MSTGNEDGLLCTTQIVIYGKAKNVPANGEPDLLVDSGSDAEPRTRLAVYAARAARNQPACRGFNSEGLRSLNRRECFDGIRCEPVASTIVCGLQGPPRRMLRHCSCKGGRSRFASTECGVSLVLAHQTNQRKSTTMSQHPLQTRVFNSSRRPNGPGRSRFGKSGRTLALEPLERRALLTTYLVNTAVDEVALDGMLSLREAVMAANTNAAVGDAPAGMNNGDRIRFDSSLNGATITLQQGELPILDDLDIDGFGRDIKIDANGASRIFRLDTSETVRLASLELTGGAVDDEGGAIATSGGLLDLRRVAILDSTASGDGGGALFVLDGQVVIRDSVISGNVADGSSGSGGGLLIDNGRVSVWNSEISGNTAVRAGGGIEIVDGQLTLINVDLGGESPAAGNFAGTSAATGNPGNGGGLHVTGIAQVVINGGTVKNNFAASEGGGLWNQAGSTLAVLNGTIISDNIASGDAADNGGGGIFNNGGTLIVLRSEISNNTANGAAGSGGGVFSTAGAVSILNSRVDGNSANRAGGGVELIDGSLSFRSSSLSNNVTGPLGFAAPGNGGGLHVSGNEADVSVLFSQVVGNFAAREGGGLWNQAGSTMNVVGSTIQGNTASGDAADDGGGGIFNNGGTVNVLRSEISNNTANGAAGSGGGVFSTAGMVQITNTHIEDNTANRAGGGVEVVDGAIDLRFSWLSRNVAGPQGSASPGNGGGLHVSGNDAEVNVFFSQVIGNLAAREGGGLWNQAGSTMNVVGSTIRENRALGTAGDDGGGGIFNNGGIMELIFAQVERNFAAGNGGGIFNLAGGEMNVRGSNISDNNADDNGGGIYNDGDLLIQLSTVRRNDASDDGGGIFNDINGELDLALTLLFDNSPNNLSGPGTLI